MTLLLGFQSFPKLAGGENLQFPDMTQAQKLLVACHKHFCPRSNRRCQDEESVLVLNFESRNLNRSYEDSILLQKPDEVIRQILTHTELKPQNTFEFLQHLL